MSIYDPTRNLTAYYVKTNGVLDGAGQPQWRVAVIPVEPGKTYEVNIATMGPYVLGLYGAAGGLPSGAIVGARVVLSSAGGAKYRFTVPTGQNIGTAFFNVNVAENDLTATFSVIEVSSKPKHLFAGDSITDFGAQGSYVTTAAEIMGVEAVNVGSSGARTSRLVGILTDQPRRDGPTTPFPVIDYSQFASMSIAVGTNDSADGGGGVSGSLDDIPLQSIMDVPYAGAATAAEHWARFPNTFYGNLALCIEYAQWKNPSMKIDLLVHPHIYDPVAKQALYSRMDSVAKAKREIGSRYGTEVIDARAESGIGAKNKLLYAPDGVHPIPIGSTKLGHFYGHRMKR